MERILQTARGLPSIVTRDALFYAGFNRVATTPLSLYTLGALPDAGVVERW